MIKFIACGPTGRRLLGLGLSWRNLELLQQGKPIFFKTDEIPGVHDALGDDFQIDDVLIFAGVSEDTMKDQLARVADIAKLVDARQ